MPDYIYLIENRLSADQKSALGLLREVAREAGIILFLTGDAVRDLTSGHAVRSLEVAVHGNALKLKKQVEKAGAKIWGEDEPSRSLYLCFPGTVRVDLISTHRTEYKRPGRPEFHPASIQEDLRRRDFTVNAMAISLNEGSYGLLMDPLNGAADIEARTLRLVSNYGFLEEPALMIRATRYRARLGWELDPRTQTRYENAREEGVIDHLSDHARSQELEQIGHEDDGLKVLRALDQEGWMKVLFPAWTPARADEERLRTLHELSVDLLLEGVHADMSAAQMQLLSLKLPQKDLAALKRQLLRPGFVEEWSSLDALAQGFAKVLLAKQNQTPSASYKLFTTYDPEAVLWLGFTSGSGPVREQYHRFLKVWPEARQRIPHALLQEMRITPDLPRYGEILHLIFLELIDGRLTTPEEMRAFLEPYSPPAPPPQVTIKRTRSKRGAEAKRERAFEEDEEEEASESLGEEDEIEELGGEDEEIDLVIAKDDLEPEAAEGREEAEAHEDEEQPAEPAPGPGKKGAPRPVRPVLAAANGAGVKAAHEGQAVPAGRERPEPAARAKPEPEKADARRTTPVSRTAPPPARPKTEPKSGAKSGARSESKSESKTESKTESRAEPKTESKAESKIEARIEARSEAGRETAPARKAAAPPPKTSRAPAAAGHAAGAPKTPAKPPAPVKPAPVAVKSSNTARAQPQPPAKKAGAVPAKAQRPAKPAAKRPVPKPAKRH